MQASYCPVINGEDIISQYGYYEVWKWIDVGVLAGIYALMVALICLSLAKIRYMIIMTLSLQDINSS